jgi:hypothetical protein
MTWGFSSRTSVQGKGFPTPTAQLCSCRPAASAEARESRSRAHPASSLGRRGALPNDARRRMPAPAGAGHGRGIWRVTSGVEGRTPVRSAGIVWGSRETPPPLDQDRPAPTLGSTAEVALTDPRAWWPSAESPSRSRPGWWGPRGISRQPRPPPRAPVQPDGGGRRRPRAPAPGAPSIPRLADGPTSLDGGGEGAVGNAWPRSPSAWPVAGSHRAGR